MTTPVAGDIAYINSAKLAAPGLIRAYYVASVATGVATVVPLDGDGATLNIPAAQMSTVTHTVGTAQQGDLMPIFPSPPNNLGSVPFLPNVMTHGTYSDGTTSFLLASSTDKGGGRVRYWLAPAATFTVYPKSYLTAPSQLTPYSLVVENACAYPTAEIGGGTALLLPVGSVRGYDENGDIWLTFFSRALQPVKIGSRDLGLYTMETTAGHQSFFQSTTLTTGGIPFILADGAAVQNPGVEVIPIDEVQGFNYPYRGQTYQIVSYSDQYPPNTPTQAVCIMASDGQQFITFPFLLKLASTASGTVLGSAPIGPKQTRTLQG